MIVRDTDANNIALQFDPSNQLWRGQFDAMASPAEVLVECTDQAIAQMVIRTVAAEAWRIEKKYSRYRDDNIIYAINNANGRQITVDAETSNLLDYAQACFKLSEGGFDITSGVLRKIWRFTLGGNIPETHQVKRLQRQIGWEKVQWEPPNIQMPAGMQLDLGGIGKEYAADQALSLLAEAQVFVLINLGGDIVATRRRNHTDQWTVGIEQVIDNEPAVKSVQLLCGGIATSGDTHRFFEVDGRRYGHLLDPRTACPVVGAPRTVTVQAQNCTEAGMSATMAMLQGVRAEEFLQEQAARFWISW